MRAAKTGSDLAMVATAFRKYQVLILCTTVLTTALAAFVAFTSPPIYRSSVVLLPVEPQSGSGGTLSRLASQFGGALGNLADLGLTGLGGTRDESIGVLQSRQLIADFIRDRNLIPVLFSDRWDTAASSWLVPADEVPSLAQAVEYFETNVRRIEEDQRSGRVALVVEWRDPELAAEWANDLVSRTNEELRRRAIESTERSIEFLKGQLEAMSVLELRQSLNAAIQGQLSTAMMARARPDFALRIVDAASVADVRDPVRPRKALLLLAGMLGGLFLGGGISIMVAAVRSMRTPSAESIG